MSFWRVPREVNTRADEFAKKAAAGDFGRKEQFGVIEPDGPIASKYTHRSYSGL